MQIEKEIEKINTSISEFNKKKRLLAQAIYPIKELEPEFIKKIEKKDLHEIKIAALDSGFIVKDFDIIEIYISKTAGFIAEYKENKLTEHYYWPKPLMPRLQSNFNSFSKNNFGNIYRMENEIDLATEIIEKFQPNYLLIDGSITPQYIDFILIEKNEEIKEKVDILLEKYQKLYDLAIEKNCMLIGCVEDSSSRLLIKTIKNTVLQKHRLLNIESLENMNDSNLLEFFLEKGERTKEISYSIDESNNKTDKLKEKILITYLKANELDKPLRLEFLKEQRESIDDKIGIIYSLSSYHKEYAYPAPLVEADLKSRLNDSDINLIMDRITAKKDHLSTMILRRDKRPF